MANTQVLKALTGIKETLKQESRSCSSVRLALECHHLSKMKESRPFSSAANSNISI